MRLTGNTIGTATVTYDVTFDEFGVRVSVTSPPASQVYNVGNAYVYINAPGGLAIHGPSRDPHRLTRSPAKLPAHARTRRVARMSAGAPMLAS